MESVYQNIGVPVVMPEFKKRYLYMYKTHMDNVILPELFQDYVPTIKNILKNIKDKNNVCYITIDEKHIDHECHRRPGIHVDYNWYEELNDHGGSTHGGHKNHELVKGGMLLVSNYPGCQVYKGQFDGVIGDDGCCKNIDVSNLQSEIMQSGYVYYINPVGIHESLKIDKEVDRTLIRINFHPEYDFKLK